VLTAVASRSIDRAVKFTAEHTQSMGHARFYGSYDELIADTLVEAVYIPLPTALMKPWVLKACNAQKHVLADKPFRSVRTRAPRRCL
jgi:predicted dehydrogenase